MAITTDPDILFVFNESADTNVPNENTGNSDGTLTPHTGGTAQYTWNQDTGSYDGYLDITDETTTDQTRIETGETWASTVVSESLAVRFQVQGYDTSNASEGWLTCGLSGFFPWGEISIRVQDPTSTGDFDLQCTAGVQAGFGTQTDAQTIFQDLSFGTDYALAISSDRSTQSAVQDRYKLNALTEYAPSTTYQVGGALDTNGPRINTGAGFTNYYGVLSRWYYYAYWRGYAISSADLALCNSAPKTTIPLWPSSGGSEGGGAYFQMLNRRQ